ncbi:MAG: DM13 domain-containing protein, partial [Nitrosopumilaceae archaeon]|nr:DM13 domain-containing protein [Nitrosopumilaceae archaeon]
ETMMEETMMEETMMEETMMEETMMEEITSVIYSGTFIGVGDGIHDAQGDAYTIPLEDGSNVLRLENFKSTNGPDLYVYLATDDNASEFLNLGELKANKGNQNYEIPDDADLTKYNKVLIWCKAFSVLFGSAELSS